MEERTTGIILRTRPLTETSLIVHWLTSDLGRLATVAKGARRLKSPFSGKLDLLYLADFTFHRSRRSDLHTLREVAVHEYNTALRKELRYLEQAAYFTRLLEQTTETDTPLPNLFQLLAGVLSFLPSEPPQIMTVFGFEMKLLRELGLEPDLAKSPLHLGSQQILRRIATTDWQTASRIKLSSGQASEIGRYLHSFLQFHFGKVADARPTVPYSSG